MRSLELVYFANCPLLLKAKSLLREAGITYAEVVQDRLPPEDPRRDYSSPSLLLNGELLIGNRRSQFQCTLNGWESVDSILNKLDVNPGNA